MSNWQAYPLSIEGPPELWKNLASYSNEVLFTPPIETLVFNPKSVVYNK